MEIKDLLNINTIPSFFILDSHQDAMSGQAEGHKHEDTDFLVYGYNVHHFNKLVPGTVFLYRRPGKLSPDRKFHIYGGGVVDSISAPDMTEQVFAKIKNGFVFKNTIDQGDPFIENFAWSTRRKPGPGWKGFWLNYGMNEIKPDDFWRLVEGRECSVKETLDDIAPAIITEEESRPIDYSLISSGFIVNIVDANLSKHTPNDYKETVSFTRRIDFNALNRRRKTIGTAGELIVLEYENERLSKLGINKQAEHVSDTIGDHLGYDIKSYDDLGNEIHIEVKTTTSSSQDRFYMSKHEIEVSKDISFKYKIYRVFNYDKDHKTADIAIFDCPLDESVFGYEAVSFRIKYQ